MGIGVEVKTLSDLLSSMTSGRLAGHQIPGLQATFDQAWLLVEGEWRPDMDGTLLTRRHSWEPVRIGPRSYTYRDLASFLLSVSIKGAIHVTQTHSRQETARWIGSLYHWWTDKAWEEHKALDAFHRKAGPVPGGFVRPSLLRRVAAELPGVGWERSAAIVKQFTSIRQMVEANEAEWQEVEGIGPKLAKQLREALNGR